jgi:glucosyl-dolichyl phosphate glucuronosyltransferase
MRPDGTRPQPTTFSAVLCAYTTERWADIQRAVASLHTQTRPPDEILLICDHNPELLALAEAAFRGVRCVANDGSRGLSDARNTGVRFARGDVVGFLDDDAAAAPDWVEQMLRAYEDETVIGVGGWVRATWRAPRPAWFPDEFLWVVGCSYAGLPTVRAPVRNPIGANMSYRRALFDAVGGFTPVTGRVGADAAGCEETEFSVRATAAHPGARIVLEPAAMVDHAVPADRVTRRYFRRRCLAEGRSKAVVGTLTGTDAALSRERHYVRRTLPAGIIRAFRDAGHGDVGGLMRAWTIVEGAAITAAGYLLARRRLAREAGPPSRSAPTRPTRGKTTLLTPRSTSARTARRRPMWVRHPSI